MKKESAFQASLIRELKERFPGCVVMKNDSGYIQGIPDLTLLFRNRWAMLECKRSANEHRQPNQEYYVEKLNAMSYAAFIFPENKDGVLNELEQALKSGGEPRVLEREQVQLDQQDG